MLKAISSISYQGKVEPIIRLFDIEELGEVEPIIRLFDIEELERVCNYN